MTAGWQWWEWVLAVYGAFYVAAGILLFIRFMRLKYVRR